MKQQIGKIKRHDTYLRFISNPAHTWETVRGAAPGGFIGIVDAAKRIVILAIGGERRSIKGRDGNSKWYLWWKVECDVQGRRRVLVSFQKGYDCVAYFSGRIIDE